MSVRAGTPTLAGMLREAGFATAAFVAAFPLDRRFGLAAGFETYGDWLPRGAGGRPANERAGQAVVDEATAWVAAHRDARMFLWVHLFEPHAPYGTPGDRRPVAARYDEEVAEADRQVGRLLEALGSARDQALVVLTGDHGEAFGEHGEIGHSVFAYDTTLRVPLVMAGPGIRPRVVAEPVGLVDVLPTALALLGLPPSSGDGMSLAPLLAGGTLAARALYAESFAPLLDFGWSPLRTLREAGRKYIAAPRPELYDLDADPGETRDLSATVPEWRGAWRAAWSGCRGPRWRRRRSPPTPPGGSSRLATFRHAPGLRRATHWPIPRIGASWRPGSPRSLRVSCPAPISKPRSAPSWPTTRATRRHT